MDAVSLAEALPAATGEPPAGVKVKEELESDEASIGREKVAVAEAPKETAVALFKGVVESTVGAAFTVVKLQETAAAKATPSAARSEERRVGKECRSRSNTPLEKKSAEEPR